MTNISKHSLFINIICSYFLLTICQKIVLKNSDHQPKEDNSTKFEKIEKNVNNSILTDHFLTLDYYFFSYDIIDHNTILIKFDLKHTNLFKQAKVLYNAHLYISKLPATNYKIDAGLFEGFYQLEIDGTIIDHFTFCLVLVPIRQKKKFNYNNQTQTIFHRYLKSFDEKQQQHILHYCTKLGPDEDRHRHHKKEGSGGDYILLLLQIMMIGIFLVVIQIAHMRKKRKLQEKSSVMEKIRHHLLFRKEHTDVSYDLLEMVRFITINDGTEVNDEEEEKDKDDSLALSRQRFLSLNTKHKRSRSPSPTSNPIDNNTKDYSIEHILKSKPWLQIP